MEALSAALLSEHDEVLCCAAEAIYGFASHDAVIVEAGGLVGIARALEFGSAETQAQAVKVVDVLVHRSKRALKEAKQAGVLKGLGVIVRTKEINPPDWKRACGALQAINQYYGISYKVPGMPRS